MSKITPGMVEAGVNAMAVAKRANPGDDVVVARVFAAMELTQRGEEARRLKTDPPAPYKHQAWPAWRHGPDGSSKVFDKAEDVPEGWTEAPMSLVAATAAEIPLRRKVRA